MIPADTFMLNYLAGIEKTLASVPIEKIAAVAEKVLEAYRQDKLVVVAGNGGSAATASHLAADLAKNILGQNPPDWLRRLRIMALTDNLPLITALANDIDYARVFAEQVKSWIRRDDLLIVMSVSGNSPNVVEAVRAAQAAGAYTIGFLGKDGGRLRNMLDLPVVVQSEDYGYVEDLHMMFSHMITACVREAVAEELQSVVAMTEAAAVKPGKALVLAAGQGTRLWPLTENCPKVMLPVAGTPLLESTIGWLRDHGITDIAVNLHYRPDAIMSHLGDGSAWDVNVRYSYENPILGTAGAVRKLQDFLGDAPFLVVYGDVLTDLDLNALLAHHKEVVARDPAAGVTLSLYHAPNPSEVGLVAMNEDGRITRFVEKPSREELFTDLANAGVLVVEPGVIDCIPQGEFYDFGHDLFPQLLESGIHLYGWVIPEETYLLDIGTPEKYARAQVEWPARNRRSFIPTEGSAPTTDD